jgi:hypothetical protein
MQRLLKLTVTLTALATAAPASALTMAYFHGRNNSTPSDADNQAYWGGTSCASYNGSASDGHNWSTSGYCGFSGYYHSSGSYDGRGRVLKKYNAYKAWWDDASTAGAICEAAAQINGIADSNVEVVAHSAGGLVITALLTDAMNGWGSACGAGVVSSAATKVTYVAAIAAPFSGTKIADAVYGHITSGGGILDWLHNLCGNTVGQLANTFADQASDMTYSLQTGQAAAYPGWMNNPGKPVQVSIGTSRSGDDSVWLGAGQSCAQMESSNDGLVSPYSGRFCSNTGAGVSGSCTGRTASFSDGVNAAIGHSSNRRGNAATSTNSSGHTHGMADLVFWHTSI